MTVIAITLQSDMQKGKLERKRGKRGRLKRVRLLSHSWALATSFFGHLWSVTEKSRGNMDLKIIEFLFVLKRCAEYKCYLNLRVIKILKTNNLLENFVSRDPNPWRKDSFPKIIVFPISVGPNPHAFILNCRLSYFKITGRLCNEAIYAIG